MIFYFTIMLQILSLAAELIIAYFWQDKTKSGSTSPCRGVACGFGEFISLDGSLGPMRPICCFDPHSDIKHLRMKEKGFFFFTCGCQLMPAAKADHMIIRRHGEGVKPWFLQPPLAKE